VGLLVALNLTSRLQVTAHYFWNRRNAAALSHPGAAGYDGATAF
jgi:hypothetical protein